MNKNEVLDKVITVCMEVFDNEELELTETSCAADVEEWDSLTHISIISDLEDEFDVKFTLDEINNSKDLGDLVNAIIKHMEE